MTNCSTTPSTPTRACSGKCNGGGCNPASTVLVLAGCCGATALFKMNSSGSLTPLESFSSYLLLADNPSTKLGFNQLILVGSAVDISWMQSLLPDHISKQVVAEIEYPLISAWFSTPANVSKLTNALDNVFRF